MSRTQADPVAAKREVQSAMDAFRGALARLREAKATEEAARFALKLALQNCGIDPNESYQIICLCESGYHVDVSKP